MTTQVCTQGTNRPVVKSHYGVENVFYISEIEGREMTISSIYDKAYIENRLDTEFVGKIDLQQKKVIVEFDYANPKIVKKAYVADYWINHIKINKINKMKIEQNGEILSKDKNFTVVRLVK